MQKQDEEQQKQQQQQQASLLSSKEVSFGNHQQDGGSSNNLMGTAYGDDQIRKRRSGNGGGGGSLDDGKDTSTAGGLVAPLQPQVVQQQQQKAYSHNSSRSPSRSSSNGGGNGSSMGGDDFISTSFSLLHSFIVHRIIPYIPQSIKDRYGYIQRKVQLKIHEIQSIPIQKWIEYGSLIMKYIYRILVWLRQNFIRLLFIYTFYWLYINFKHFRHHCKGTEIDERLRRRMIRFTFRQQKKFLDQKGIILPRVQVDFSLNLNTHASLRELLIRREYRNELLEQLDQQMISTSSILEKDLIHQDRVNSFYYHKKPQYSDPTNYQLYKSSQRMIRSSTNTTNSTTTNSTTTNQNKIDLFNIPKWLYVPTIPATWIPLRPGQVTNFSVLTFDEYEMRNFIADTYPIFLDRFDSLPPLTTLATTISNSLISSSSSTTTTTASSATQKREQAMITLAWERIMLWSLCALYTYGGVFVHSRTYLEQHGIYNIHESIFPSSPTNSRSSMTTRQQQQRLRYSTSSNSNNSNNNITDSLLDYYQQFFLYPNRSMAIVALGVNETITRNKQKKHHDTRRLLLFASTPRHPVLRCLLQFAQTKQLPIGEMIYGFLDSTMVDTTINSMTTTKRMTHQWQEWTTPFTEPPYYTSCSSIHNMKKRIIPKYPPPSTFFMDLNNNNDDPTNSTDNDSLFYVGVFPLVSTSTSLERSLKYSTTPPGVEIQEMDVEGFVHNVTLKKTFYDELRKIDSLPGYFCTRCLNYAGMGSYDKCSWFCPVYYRDIMCRNRSIIPQKTIIPIDITIYSPQDNTQSEEQELDKKGSNKQQQEKRQQQQQRPRNPSIPPIPRIIHQTYYNTINADEYPDLFRLRNSWLNSGWEYRFYTDADARQYIIRNYPPRFLAAFDDITYGAYKADLFRYLVLLKDGGVYADVDILLEANLDTFIIPGLTFFAARDLVGEYANQPFCLWNGLVGVAPGHPFLIRAVERLVSLIENRADMYDMEHELCQRNGENMAIWTVRDEVLLLLSGPCALGVSVNDALNRSSTTAFDIGWLGLDQLEFGGRKDHGDALILVGDKFDLGSFRLSDPERHMILASTELPLLSKTARVPKHISYGDFRRQTAGGARKNHAHYSESEQANNIWGSSNVYVDRYVSNEQIKFTVQYF